MAADELIIKIGAKANEFRSELEKVKKQVKGLEVGLAKTAKISATSFVALSGAAALATKRFAKFESGFTNVQTLLDKSSFSTKTLSKGINDLKNEVLQLGAESGESFEDLNQGLFDLVSAGVPAEEATLALSDAVDLATAGATNTAVAVKALTSAMTSFGDDAGTSTEIAEKFFTAQKFGVTTVEELAVSFNKVAGLSKQLGLSFDETLSAATALTANGAKPTAQAFTEFRAVLNSVILAQGKLAGQSKEVQDALSLQNIKQKGIVVSLNELKIATGNDVVAIQKLLGSSEALSAALSLTGAQAGAFTKIMDGMSNSQERAATFADALAVKQATTERSMKRLKSSADAVAITIGERLAPDINKLADSMTELIKGFNSLSDEQKDAIVGAGKLVTALTAVVAIITTAGLAFLKVRTVFVAIGNTLAKIGPAIGRISTRIAGMSVSFAELGGFAKTALTGVAGTVGTILGLLTLSGDTVKETFLGAGKSIEDMQKKIDQLKGRLITEEDIGQALPENFKKANEEITSLIGQYEEAIKKQKELNLESLPEDFGTGEILLEPKIQETSGNPAQDIVNDILGGKDAVEIPFKTVQQEAAAAETAKAEEQKAAAVSIPDSAPVLTAAQKAEEEKNKIAAIATQKRIETARAENQNLLEIADAKNQGFEEKEIGFLERRQKIDAEFKEAQKIKNEEERLLEIEGLQLKNEELLIEEQLFNEAKAEQDILDKELELERKDEFDSLVSQKVKKDSALKKKAKDEFVALKADEQKKLLATLKELNKQSEALDQARNDKAIGFAKATGDAIIALTGDSGTASLILAKSFAIAEVFIADARARAFAAAAAASAAASAGPAAPAVFAGVSAQMQGAITASTALSLGTIAAQTVAQVARAQRGGVIGNDLFTGGSRDKIPALLEEGEVVVPKAVAPDFIQAVGRPEVSAETGEGGGTERIEIGFTDNAFEIIERKREEDVALGIREA